MRDMKCKWVHVVGAMASMAVLSCSDKDDGATQPKVVTHTYKVAVLLEGDDQARWEKTAQWALKNIADAQQGMNSRVELQLTFKDQDAADIADYMAQLAEDTTVRAIIGPCASDRAEQMAVRLGDAIQNHYGNTAYRKPMISPTATDVEYQRKFSGTDYVWNMSECDIAQLEILIAAIANQTLAPYGTVTLVAPTTEDGLSGAKSSYAEWFAFIAEEYGLKVKDVLLYKDIDELRTHARTLPASYTIDPSVLINSVVFIPSGIDESLAFDKELNSHAADSTTFIPPVYCSDVFVSPTVAAGLSRNSRLSYEGVDLYAWPESGFTQAYSQHFGTDMVSGEAQLYDALCLVAYAATWSQYSHTTLNEAVRAVVDGNSGEAPWNCFSYGMTQVFSQLQKGQRPSIKGATGPWLFDPKYHTNRRQSTYRRWRYYEGDFLTTGYATSVATSHSLSSQDVWQWTAQRIDTQIPSPDAPIAYPELKDRWALLVAGSKSWANYRFQADVLAMYQLLRRHGYDDDHIVLIVEDDLAENPENRHDKGNVRISESGPNLRVPEAIDYKLSALSPDDIGNILQGQRSQQLPHVITPTENDNVLLFWCSHGNPGTLDFGERTMGYHKLKNFLAQTPHRKMMVVVEACYSGGLGDLCTGLPATLLLTAANSYETSKASGWSSRIGVYLTNSFTDGLQETLSLRPAITLRDLYFSLASTVSGSHVKLYNTANYGNAYGESMSEFLK